MTDTPEVERVAARRLRAGDTIATCAGAVWVIVQIEGAGDDRYRVRTAGGRSFTCLATTQFLRVRSERRINMRPDLDRPAS